MIFFKGVTMYQTPSTQASNILNRYSRPSIGYSVTVWNFKNSKELNRAYNEVLEAVGDFISLVKIKTHINKQTPRGKDNFIQIFD